MNDVMSIYNSRIIKIYLTYLNKHYPDLDIQSILADASMTPYEVEDPGHWFNQSQVDRFYESLVKNTCNPNIAREAGRYAASSEGMGPLKQYAIGFMGPTSVYLLMEKIYAIMSRGAAVTAKKLGTNKVEIVSTPAAGTHEKPHQCENRIGTFESIAKLFTGEFASIEHPSCFHRGDQCCRYIVTWKNTPALLWKQIRNYLLVFSVFLLAPLFFFLSHGFWLSLVALYALLTLSVSLYSERLEKNELIKTIEIQGEAAKDHLEEINIRYNNALLVQEIGQATSVLLDIRKLLTTVTDAMERRLDFDRGGIWMANSDKTRLVYQAGFGYNPEIEKFLQTADFHLDNPRSRGVAVQGFQQQKIYLVNNINEIETYHSKRSMNFIKQIGTQSFICVPIVFKGESLGVLFVDNLRSKRLFTQSDISLLMGVASQLAVSISNALSFQKIQESEEKYRELVQNANSIILRRDPEGNITFINEFAQSFFGYTEKEILGKNVAGTIIPSIDSSGKNLEAMIRDIGIHPERYAANENENMKRNGELVQIAWTNRAIRDSKGDIIEILCIGNDITERKLLESQLQQVQRMEAIGTLAGGIAHNFNNILMGISGNTSLMLLETDAAHPHYRRMQDIEKLVESGSKLTRQLLGYARGGKYEVKPVSLNSVITETADTFGITKKEITIHRDLIHEPWGIMADQSQIEQVLLNLFVNAADAMPRGGDLFIETTNVTHKNIKDKPYKVRPGNYVLLTVRDTGIGMDQKTKKRIFEPFFTTKSLSKGSGLGLASVYGIIKAHGGYIDVESHAGQGASFRIYLPASENDVEKSVEDANHILSGTGTILLVDDEAMLLDASSEALKKLGYQVFIAQSGREAIEVFRENMDSIELVILDMIMPDMGGGETFDRMKEIKPQVKVLLSSGYSINGQAAEILERGCSGFIQKPFSVKELSARITEILIK